MAKNNWKEILPMAFPHDTTKPFGFVVDHRTYLGIPIPGLPGFPKDPKPTQPSDPSSAPKALIIKKKPAPQVKTSQWTGGNFSILATRTPPLFHAFHHKTDEFVAGGGGHGGGHGGGGSEHFVFEPRSETNVIERSFAPRNPLPGRGRFACVELFTARFRPDGKPDPIDLSKHTEQPEHKGNVKFSLFDTRAIVKEARRAGYFETRHNSWNDDLVGPLNFLWIVFLEAGKRNTPLQRLGNHSAGTAGYRLWHRLTQHGNPPRPTDDGYKWTIRQRNDFHEISVSVELSETLNTALERCPSERAILTFEFEWSS